MPVSPILNMFGRSPIRPLEEHMTKVHACVRQLLPFFEALIQQDWPRTEMIQQQVARLELEADQMKRELRLHMPKSLFMPISRNDLLELLSLQDRLAKQAKDIAGMALGRQMVFPDLIRDSFLNFLSRCIEASKQANTIIQELEELLETGFSGAEVKLVENMIAKLSSIEAETDELKIQLMRKIFSIEDTLLPVRVMFLYQIMEWTGELADLAQDIGDRLQILLAR